MLYGLLIPQQVEPDRHSPLLYSVSVDESSSDGRVASSEHTIGSDDQRVATGGHGPHHEGLVTQSHNGLKIFSQVSLHRHQLHGITDMKALLIQSLLAAGLCAAAGYTNESEVPYYGHSPPVYPTRESWQPSNCGKDKLTTSQPLERGRPIRDGYVRTAARERWSTR